MRKEKTSLALSIVAIFSGLIAVLTIVSVPLPPPLYEITLAPPVYMALSILVDPWLAFSATAVGSFIGEAYTVSFRGGGSPIYPLGMVWARAPEALIIGLARDKSPSRIALYMLVATVYETLAFFFPDWLFYTYGLFQYGNPMNSLSAFYLASFDFGTLVDLAYIPVALGIIRAARPAFRRIGL